ncbi:PAS domain-containing hybrid sensor histidine kinase/response regulator [Noviherbaspirillum saxi]|uniref:PAS domain-containing hybrid sensor histidine kinase/response regulator n=1 Tax=Noviherbaspirillum saxi TaxID=2320863 RepID=UPI0011C39E37|nr:ATP-binding protein [Noviherbaspirillum saxi]
MHSTNDSLKDKAGDATTILESITDASCFVDKNWEFTYVNRQAKAYHKAASEQVGTTVISYYPDHDRWYEAHAYPATVGISIYFRNVTERVRAEPYRDSQTGEIRRWFGTSTDVHDLKVAESALKKSEEKYRSLFESIDEGFCVIEMLYDQDEQACDYRFCEVNPMFEQQTGLRNSIGKTIRELAPLHETHWIEIYGKVAKTGEPVRFKSEAKALDRWFDVYAFRLDAADSKQVGVLFKDISEQRRADEELLHSRHQALAAAREAEAERHRLNAVLEAVPVGIVVSDASGAIRLANASNRRLWGERHPISEHIEDFSAWKGWWADGSARTGLPLQPSEWTTARILRGEEALEDIIEIESFDAPPVRRIVFNTGAPIKDDDGRVVGAVVAQMDITNRVRAEEALRQADRRNDEFRAMLAHELRNLLAPISTAADLLTLSQPSAERLKQTSATISRQVAHMIGLVDDLVDVSRVTRGLVSLEKAKLDAKHIVSDAVEQVRPLIESRRHRLTVRTPPESTFVLGDKKRLVQVMSNLLNNAAKYTPAGGDIVLNMDVYDDQVWISVTDNGIGMSPDVKERAFELFAQAERTPDRAQGGLGIGLALVKSLIDLHGGSVTAHSEGMGTGSTFTVRLPHLDEGTGSAAIEQPAQPEATPRRVLKVMVVDDNADAADMLAMFVEAVGHQACVEHSAHKALERARMENPDVCLLDIGMPDMDGNELARRLRIQPENVGTILVAVTGYGQDRHQHSSQGAGFDHYFVKPVDIAKLVSLLNDIGNA